MPKYTADECRKLMDDVKVVRNVVILGEKGHGKTCLADNFGVQQGYLAENKVGETLFMHLRADEKEKKSTIKANLLHVIAENVTHQDADPAKNGLCEIVPLPERKENGKFLYTIVDTPGHIEYSPEYQAGVRMCDSFIITVSAGDGVGVMAEYMIQNSLKEKLKPIAFINKLDNLITVNKKDGEEIYQDCASVITGLSIPMCKADELKMKECALDPLKNNVIFGSASGGWGFTIQTAMDKCVLKAPDGSYKKMPAPMVKKLWEKLWGDKFSDATFKSWKTTESNGFKRGACSFIFDNIVAVYNSVIDEKHEEWQKILKASAGIELKFSPPKNENEQKALFRTVMQAWMPLYPVLNEVIATHAPNPQRAQQYRMDKLYKGELDSDIGQSMVKCDHTGPLMMHAVKMTPTGSAGRFYSVGRIFSGTVSTEKYFIRGTKYDPEDPETLCFSNEARVVSTYLSLGKEYSSVMNVPCGNICSIQGLDNCMTKASTVCSKKDALTFTNLPFQVSCVYKVAIKPADPKNLPKLVVGIQRLLKADMIVETTSDQETGAHIISFCGSEHVRVLMRDLRHEHAQIDFKEDVPTVSMKETVTMESSKIALAKSPNKHNRLYISAVPMEAELVDEIENYNISMTMDPKKRKRMLIDNHGWDSVECAKLWSFGPTGIDVGGANCLIDMTKGIQYLNEIKESVNDGFANNASVRGPLADENMRGVRFNLLDVKLHADSIHRGMGQISGTTARVLKGAVLYGAPRFLEPIFKCVINSPEECKSGVSTALMGKRGVTEEEFVQDGKLITIAHLPVMENIGENPFAQVLQTKTSGKALATFNFARWDLVQADPLEKDSKSEKMMLGIRERKGLKVEQPNINDYVDRL